MARFAKSVNPSFNACVLNDIADGIKEIRNGWSVGRNSLVILTSPKQESNFPPRFTPFIPHLLLSARRWCRLSTPLTATTQGCDPLARPPPLCPLPFLFVHLSRLLHGNWLRFFNFPRRSPSTNRWFPERLELWLGGVETSLFQSPTYLPPPSRTHSHTLCSLYPSDHQNLSRLTFSLPWPTNVIR